MSTFEYIMHKREKLQKKKEADVQKLEAAIKIEEEKFSESRNSPRSGVDNVKTQRNPYDQNTKVSNAENKDGTSEGSLIKPNRQLDVSKDDEVFDTNQEDDSNPANDRHEVEFRITSSSNWKIRDESEDHAVGAFVALDDGIENEIPHPRIVEFKKSSKLTKSKITNLQVIDDVSESKEISRSGYESISKLSKISSLKKPRKNKLKALNESSGFSERNNINSSGLLKS
jgi:hypothetical protein